MPDDSRKQIQTGEDVLTLEVVEEVDVTYDLKCDTCDFARSVDAESSAYSTAKDHESDHPDHFVLIYDAE